MPYSTFHSSDCLILSGCLVVVTERQMEAGEAERSHTGPGGAADWPLLGVADTRAA